MGLEAATLISQLVSTNPVGGDLESQGDDHLRLIKAVLQSTFPGTSSPLYLGTGFTNVASAATTDLGAVASQMVNVTGSVTITGFGTVQAGAWRVVKLAAAPLLTHQGTSLILPNAGNNIQGAAGDAFLAVSMGSGNWIVPIYQKASGLALVAPSFLNLTDTPSSYVGQTLKLARVNAGETAIEFVTPPNTWTTIVSAAVSGTPTNLDFASLGTYDELELFLLGIVPTTDNVDINLRMSQATVFLAGASDYQWGAMGGGNGFNFGAADDADSEIALATNLGNAANENYWAKIRVFRHSAAGAPKSVLFESGFRSSSAAPITESGWGQLIANTAAIDGLRLFLSSGTFSNNGFYTLKGLKW